MSDDNVRLVGDLIRAVSCDHVLTPNAEKLRLEVIARLDADAPSLVERGEEREWRDCPCGCGGRLRDIPAPLRDSQPSTEGAGGRLVEALRELASMRCSDGYCDLAGRATGQHTNMGCQCLREIRNPRLRAWLRQALSAARQLSTPNASAPEEDR